jgi:hypothetical protein
MVETMIREFGKNFCKNIRSLKRIRLESRFSIFLYLRFVVCVHQSFPKHDSSDRGWFIQPSVPETAYAKLFDSGKSSQLRFSDWNIYFTMIAVSGLELDNYPPGFPSICLGTAKINVLLVNFLSLFFGSLVIVVYFPISIILFVFSLTLSFRSEPTLYLLVAPHHSFLLTIF